MNSTTSDARRWVALHCTGGLLCVMDIHSILDDMEGAIAARQPIVHIAQIARRALLLLLTIRSIGAGGEPSVESHENIDVPTWDPFTGVEPATVQRLLDLLGDFAFARDDADLGRLTPCLREEIQRVADLIGLEQAPEAIRREAHVAIRSWVSMATEFGLPDPTQTEWDPDDDVLE